MPCAVQSQCRPSPPHPQAEVQVTNWRDYDASLRQRGSLTVWFTEEAIAAWKAEPRTTRGGQPTYSDLAILTALTLRAVLRLALRQTEGLIGSVIGVALDRWEDLASYCVYDAFIRPAALTHEVQQRLVLGGRSTGSCNGRQWFDALAFHRHQQNEAIISERSCPVGMPQGCRESLDIGRKTIFTLRCHGVLRVHDGSELERLVAWPTRLCDSVIPTCFGYDSKVAVGWEF